MASKNILIFVGNDFISHLFLNHFIPRAKKMGIQPILARVINKSHNEHTELNRYNFYETQLLNQLIYPYLEQSDETVFTMKTPNQLIKKYKLESFDVQDVNDLTTSEKINTLNIIGAISVRCFQIFKSPVIQTIKKQGFFCNSHPGVLPDYRGVFCMLRGIVNREKKIAWTLHDIDEGIDTGKIIQEVSFTNYRKNQSLLHIMADTAPHLSEAWLDFIYETTHNDSVGRKQQQSHGSYYTYPTEQEFDCWYDKNLLHPIIPKEIVKFYYDMFVNADNKFKPEAQDFKVQLIMEVARFETMIEMQRGDKKTTTAIPISKKVA